MKLNFGNILDKEEDEDLSDDEEEENNGFVKKLFGRGITYQIKLVEQGDYILVKEYSEIEGVNLLIKMIWVVLGWYLRFRQRKVHRAVKNEIEAM